jgi:penicillin-binding protein 1B
MLRHLFLGLLFVCTSAVSVGGVFLWYSVSVLDAVVAEKFRTHEWSFPSKIYSDTLLVYPGLDLAAAGFFPRLRELGYREVSGPVSRKGEYCWQAGKKSLEVHLNDVPPGHNGGGPRFVRLRLTGDTVRKIEDALSGEELYSVDLEPALIMGLYDNIWEERRLVTLHEVSPYLLRAVIDTEDRHFYDHFGIDLSGIARATWVNLRRGQISQGGSTLTQQLMKNFFLSSERSFERKLHEALMAVVVERRFSKDEILENYVNEIYLGQRGAQGVFGVWEASRFYFAKEPIDLTAAEAALLAGLIRAPNRYSPFRHPERALERRNYVLTLMFKYGDLTPDEFEAAIAEPLRTEGHPPSPAKAAPYFVDLVRKELSETYADEVLTTEGLVIHTALDPYLQRQAEEAVQSGLAALEERHPRLRSENPEKRLQACLIALHPQTGGIKAMIGGRAYRATQFNRCTQARRQPGSVFKPFTSLAAFEQSRDSAAPILATTRIEDQPFEWAYDNQLWTPANYKDMYLGTVTVRQALERSLNAATARLAHQVGLPAIIDVARRMGIESTLPPYPSVVLGAVEVTPFEVAQAFSVLANSGLRARPLTIKKVVDRLGEPMERNPIEVELVLEPDTAYLVTHLMEGVLLRGTGRGARERGFKRPAAGKTGTTDDYRDAWFVGFTPNLLTVVWVGFDDNRTLDLSGAATALPIWTEFMKAATAARPAAPFLPPPGVTNVKIDPVSGMLATAECPTSIDEAFYTGQEPQTPCPLHSPWYRRPGFSSAPHASPGSAFPAALD